MGYRNFDWECTICGTVRESLVWVDHGSIPQKTDALGCQECGSRTEHERRISLTAEVHCDKVLSPVVYGGAFDTVGFREVPTMDALPNLPPNASANDRKERVDAYKERFRSPEWKDMKDRQKSIMKENKAKQKRHEAMMRGEHVNMRQHKLPGDPKVTA